MTARQLTTFPLCELRYDYPLIPKMFNICTRRQVYRVDSGMFTFIFCLYCTSVGADGNMQETGRQVGHISRDLGSFTLVCSRRLCIVRLFIV
jgi:hypothetical protein